MKLLIVESPNKIKKIKSCLGSGWDVKASVGHFRDMPRSPTDGTLGYDPKSFAPHYEISPERHITVNELRSAAAKADEIYLGSDPDREGEAISFHLKEVLGLSRYKRVRFHEITEKAIKQAIAEAEPSVNMPLIRAQEARRVLDRMVGYRVSPVLPASDNGRALSAGRVQSPALRLVVDRENEIRNHKSLKHFEVEAKADAWKATWVFTSLLKGDEKHWVDRAVADQVAQTKTLVCRRYKLGKMKVAPPPPFITLTLMQAAVNALGMTVESATKVAQQLFEQGHITYIRTDSPTLSADAVTDIRNLLATEGKALSPDARNWKGKADAQEAHEAIRPSHIEEVHAGETDDQRRMYTLIRNRTLACQMSDALFDTADALFDSVEVKLGDKPAQFKARGILLRDPGWKALTSKAAEEEDDAEDEPPLPQMSDGQRFGVICAVLAKETRATARYTPVTLLKKLEMEGIGRPSTYATIVATLTRREYIKIKAKKIEAMPTGERVCEALVNGQFSFIDLPFTRRMEENLDRIAGAANDAEASALFLQSMTEADQALTDEISRLPEKTRRNAAPIEPLPGHGDPCPRCKKGVKRTLRVNKEGPNQGKRFIVCSALPDCKYSDFPVAEWGERAVVEPIPGHGDVCPKCKKGKLVTRATKADPDRRFLSCNAYPQCNHSVWPQDENNKFDPLPDDGFDCPKCKKGKLTTVMVYKDGPNKGRRFYSCSLSKGKGKGCRYADFPSSEGWETRKS